MEGVGRAVEVIWLLLVGYDRHSYVHTPSLVVASSPFLDTLFARLILPSIVAQFSATKLLVRPYLRLNRRTQLQVPAGQDVQKRLAGLIIQQNRKC